MKKNTKVIATSDWMNRLVKGHVFTVVKSYFWNGEGWLCLKNSKGEIVELPDVFFEEI